MTRLKSVLEGYSTWSLPHPGDPSLLDKAQRSANLAFVMSNKADRISHLCAALPEIAGHIASLLDPAQHPFAAVRELDNWWIDTGLQLSLFPPLAGTLRSKLFKNRYYAANQAIASAYWYDWSENPLVHPLDSLLRDIALVVGDAVTLRRPDFAWGVNEDPKERRIQTMEWGRVVVMREASGGWPLKAFDMFNLARHSYADLHRRKRNRLKMQAVDVGGGDWRGIFVGWTAVAIVNGGFTPDHYPLGHAGPAAAGRWLNSPASRQI